MKYKKLLKKSLWNSLLITMIYAIIYILYNTEFVRERAEDISYDIINKYQIQDKYVPHTKLVPSIHLLAFDNLYMKKMKLFDEFNKPNFGYHIPRAHIIKIIKKLDDTCEILNKRGIASPKALFIDFDFSYTEMPNGKTLSKDDIELIKILEKPISNKERPYVIVLPKTETSNFVEDSNSTIIQKQIKDKKIILASVNFLKSKDYSVRRYQAYEIYRNPYKKNMKQFYPNVNILLWKLYNNQIIDTNLINNEFSKDDIVQNRIFIKSYKKSYMVRDSNVSESNWGNLQKYTAYYNLALKGKKLSNSIIILGANFTGNNDKFDILNVFNNEIISGAELHAHALMTLFYHNGQIKRIGLFSTILLVFCLLFIINILVRYFIRKESWHWEIVLILSLIWMLILSTVLINSGIWFNWFPPALILESI